MAGTPISFSIVKTCDQNKKLEKDESGYYKVTLGAINSFNSAGNFYIADGVRDLVEGPSSLFNKRLKSGYLNGELGHPEFKPGMSQVDYINRNLKIDISNISHHIKEVIFVPTDIPSGRPGAGNIIKIMGWIKPSGPKGSVLQQSIENYDQNTAFSIRCLTKDNMVNGTVIKQILSIITWDNVVEPGIKHANSWDTLAQEGFDIATFYAEDVLKEESKIAKQIGLESADDMNMLKQVCQRAISPTQHIDSFLKW